LANATITMHDELNSSNRRWQFSVRTMFAVIAVLGLLMAINRHMPGGAWIVLSWPGFVISFWFAASLASVPVWLVAAWRREKTTTSRLSIALRAPFQVLAGRAPEWDGLLGLVAMGIIASVLLPVTWIAWRQLGMIVSASATNAFAGDPTSTPARMAEWRWSELKTIFHWGAWQRMAFSEAWSQVRWWLLFGMLTGIGRVFQREVPSINSQTGSLARRLLAFVPWIAVLELGFLCGGWLFSPTSAVEPNPIFMHEPQWNLGINLTPWEPSARNFWLLRGTVPTALAGFVFFRRVLRFDYFWAIALSIALVPAAISWSIVWSWIYVVFFLHDPIRLGR
jgi:hypothetical protein